VSVCCLCVCIYVVLLVCEWDICSCCEVCNACCFKPSVSNKDSVQVQSAKVMCEQRCLHNEHNIHLLDIMFACVCVMFLYFCVCFSYFLFCGGFSYFLICGFNFWCCGSHDSMRCQSPVLLSSKIRLLCEKMSEDDGDDDGGVVDAIRERKNCAGWWCQN
jgi:hypothetical protein